MHRPRMFVVLVFAFIISAGCGKKAPPAGDEPVAVANPPAPKPAPKPPEPDPQPNDGTDPANKNLFPIPLQPMPMTPANPMVDPMPPTLVPMPKMPDPFMPPVLINPNPQDKKDSTPPMPLVVQPPVDPKLPPPKKEDDKKDPPKQGSVIVWPTDVGGKDAKGYLKDLTDPDPAIRVIALQTLPMFGPDVKKATTPDGKTTYGKALLARIDKQTEADPWVRLAAFELVTRLGFEEEPDAKEAVRLLGLIAEESITLRPQAIQTLATFGNRGEPAVQHLVGGPALSDPSYETRRSIAATLGVIGVNEKTGPNPRALSCLTKTLIHDKSAAVRLEAMQALVTLGPPHHKVMVPNPLKKGEMMESMVIDPKAAKGYIDAIKQRLAPHIPKAGETMNPTGVVESNKQVEIWARAAVIRFDPVDELNKENLDGITKYIKGTEYGPKIQGIFVLGLMGEYGARRIDDVIRELNSDDPYVVYTAATALAHMGTAAKPAIPELEKLKGRGKDVEEKKYYAMLAEEAIKAIKDPPKAPDPKEKK